MLDISAKFRRLSRNTQQAACGHGACAISRDLRVEGQKRPPNTWDPRPRFVYSLYNFYGATMVIKGSVLSRVAIVSDFRWKICSPFFAKNRRMGALNRPLILPLLLAIELALFVRCVTYISNLRKIGQKLRSLSRAIGRGPTRSDRRTLRVILYCVFSAMNCIGQTIIHMTWEVVY